MNKIKSMRRNEIRTKFDEERDVPFEVVGAGNIILSVDNDHHCGGIQGFSFGVEWGGLDILEVLYQMKKLSD